MNIPKRLKPSFYILLTFTFILIVIQHDSLFLSIFNFESLNFRKCSSNHRELEPVGKNELNIYSYPYNYVTTLDEKCKTEEKIDIVFLIKTCLKNLERRSAVRETWAIDDRFPDVKIRHVFLMGVDLTDNLVRVETLQEHDQFGDILLADFHDHYFNSSLKCILGINWARKYCPNSKFYIIADDDTYISVKHLVAYLRNNSQFDPRVAYAQYYVDHELDSSSLELKFYGGYVIVSPVVDRNLDSHLYVSMEEYPYPNYPDTINGHTIIMTKNVLDEFYYAAHFTKFFRMDDVYLALLAERANIKPFHIPQVLNWPPGDVNNLDLFNDVISVHKIGPQDLRRIHKAQVERGNA